LNPPFLTKNNIPNTVAVGDPPSLPGTKLGPMIPDTILSPVAAEIVLAGTIQPVDLGFYALCLSNAWPPRRSGRGDRA
jgi:hypothetical protein